jgi:hypothetical protein
MLLFLPQTLSDFNYIFIPIRIFALLALEFSSISSSVVLMDHGFLRFVMVQCGGRPRADMESAPTAFPL